MEKQKKVTGVIRIRIHTDPESQYLVATSQDISGFMVTGKDKKILEEKIDSILPMLIEENLKCGIFPGAINRVTASYQMSPDGTVKCSTTASVFG